MTDTFRCHFLLATVAAILGYASSVRTAYADEPAPASTATAPQEHSRDLLRRQLYARTVESAWLAWQHGEITRARELLQQTAPELRSWEYGYLQREFEDSRRIYKVESYGKPAGIRHVTFSPDGALLAASADDLRAKVWDIELNQLLFDEHDETRTVEFDPDGNLLLTGLSDQLNLRDARSGTIVDQFRVTNSSIAGIPLHAQFAPKGDTIAAQDSHRGVRLLDSVTAQEKFYFQDHKYSYVFRFHPSGDKLAVVTRVWNKDAEQKLQYGIELWDLTELKPTLDKTIDVHDQHSLRSLDFSPDGSQLAVCGSLFSNRQLGQCSVFDAETGNRIQVLRDARSNMTCVRFSPDGQRLATGALDGTVRLWDRTDGACIKAFRGHTESVRTIAFCPDGRMLASGSADGTIRLWTLDDVARDNRTQLGSWPVPSAALTGGGKRLYAPWSSYDQEQKTHLMEFRITDTQSGATLPSTQIDQKYRIVSYAESHDSRLLAQSLGRNQSYLANHPDPFLSQEDTERGTIRITNRSTSETMSEFECPRPPRAIAFSPDDRCLYTVSPVSDEANGLQKAPRSPSGFVIAGWEAATGNPLFQTTVEDQVEADQFAPISVSPDGSLLAAVGIEYTGPNQWNRLIYLFNRMTGQQVGQLLEPDCFHIDYHFSPDSNRLAVAVEKDYAHEFRGYVSVWNLSDRQKTLMVPAYQSDIHAVRFTPDGRRVAAAGGWNKLEGGEVTFWDPDSGERVFQLDDFPTQVIRLEFNREDRSLVTLQKDGTLRIMKAD